MGNGHSAALSSELESFFDRLQSTFVAVFQFRRLNPAVEVHITLERVFHNPAFPSSERNNGPFSERAHIGC